MHRRRPPNGRLLLNSYSATQRWNAIVAELSGGDLAKVEREFERIGLLLSHDPALPSFTALVTGAPFGGSWWSHPQAHDIYRLLGRFHRGAGALSAKLVNGKVTYINKRLWPSLLNVVRGRAVWQRGNLSGEAQALHRAVQRRRSIRADRLRTQPASTRSAAILELEKRLLVHSTAVHTETGNHQKLLRTWAQWCTNVDYSFERYPPARGREELDEAARVLANKVEAAAKLPWSDGELPHLRRT